MALGLFLSPPRRARRRVPAALFVVGVTLLVAPHAARAQNPLVNGNSGRGPVNPTTVNGTFTCDVLAGNITVNYSSAVEVYAGPNTANNFRAGAGAFQTILAGMTITAQATPVAPFTGVNWAWMQAITTDSTPSVVRDAGGNALATPYPDTPPGGYQFQPFGVGAFIADPWDNIPWYGNNGFGQLDLYDQPRDFISPANGATTISFESWLVCVTRSDNAVRGNYTVLPLVGFTWGFTYNYGADANGNNNGTLGDDIREYTGATNFGGLTQGGQPSAAFKAGYNKYWNVNYLNNPQECENCLAAQSAPEPGPFHLIAFLAASSGAGAIIKRRVGG
jgi:hypothetical protein